MFGYLLFIYHQNLVACRPHQQKNTDWQELENGIFLL